MITKRSWILVGILLWGLPTSLAFTIIMTFTDPAAGFQFRPFETAIFLRNLFIYFPVFVAAGVLLGLFMFRMSPISKKDEA